MPGIYKLFNLGNENHTLDAEWIENSFYMDSR